MKNIVSYLQEGQRFLSTLSVSNSLILLMVVFYLGYGLQNSPYLRLGYERAHEWSKTSSGVRREPRASSKSRVLKIEHEQIKTAQNNSYGLKKLRETTYFCIEIMNCKRQVNGKIGHVAQIRVYRLT